MRRSSAWRYWVGVLILSTGCSRARDHAQADQEKQVREAFAALQKALKDGDGDKLWTLLDAASRADAERAANALKLAYAKADAKEKAEQQEALGLSAAELDTLSGAGFLKSKRFLGKYDEVPGSKIDKVTIEGDTATIHYIEPDGDKETAQVVHQDGRWRFSLRMPKVSQP